MHPPQSDTLPTFHSTSSLHVHRFCYMSSSAPVPTTSAARRDSLPWASSNAFNIFDTRRHTHLPDHRQWLSTPHARSRPVVTRSTLIRFEWAFLMRPYQTVAASLAFQVTQFYIGCTLPLCTVLCFRRSRTHYCTMSVTVTLWKIMR